MSSKTSEIVRMRKAGTSPTVISKFLGLSNEHVRQVLFRKNLVKRRLAQDQIDRLYEMANNGTKTRDLATIFDVSVSTVQWYLRKAGAARKVGTPNKPKKKSYLWDIPKKSRSI